MIKMEKILKRMLYMRYVKLTKLDQQLLEELQKDGRKSYTELAEKFEANVSTVSNRIQRLIDKDILKIVGVVNPFKTGNSFVVDLKIKTELRKLEKVIDELSAINEVRFIASTTGTYDLIAEVYTPSSYDLHQLITEKINKIDGILELDTSVLLKVHKQSYNFGVRLD